MTPRVRVCAFLPAAAVALGVAVGCRAEPPADMACTARGGVPELRVVVMDAGEGHTVRVDAIAVGTAPRALDARLDSAAGTCVGAACAGGIALYGFAPDTAVVTIVELGQQVRHVAVPRYGLHFPNGPACGDAVRIGRVTFAAP